MMFLEEGGFFGFTRAGVEAIAFSCILFGCIVNTDPVNLKPPGAADAQDEDVKDTDSFDTFPDLPDCDWGCREGWTAACSSEKNWCISPCQGVGNCCEAWIVCRGQGAYPGFWPNAGPYPGIFPPDFSDFVDLPGVVTSFSGYNEEGIESFNIACFSGDGVRVRGYSYNPDISQDCLLQDCIPLDYYPGDCGDFSEFDCCTDQYSGCLCSLPFWCVEY